MPRHYNHGVPKRQLLEIQLRDIRELLDGHAKACFAVPSYRPIRTSSGWGRSDKPDGLAAVTLPIPTDRMVDLQLLSQWIENELERV